MLAKKAGYNSVP